MNTTNQERDEVMSDIDLELDNPKEALLNEFVKEKKEGIHLISKYLVDKHHIISLGEHVREIYIYTEGVYIKDENSCYVHYQYRL